MREAVSSLVLSATLIPLSIQDWKSNEVSGVLCLFVWLLIFACWAYCGIEIISGIMLLALLILFYSKLQIPSFGDADILPIAMFIAVYSRFGLSSPLFVIYPTCTLIILIPYGKFYAKKHNIEWHFGSKVFMPMLPCMAAGWWLSTLSYSLYFFVLGGNAI